MELNDIETRDLGDFPDLADGTIDEDAGREDIRAAVVSAELIDDASRFGRIDRAR